MKPLAILVVATFLASCGSPVLFKDGAPTDPPTGYVKLCREHPEAAACPK